MNAAEKRFWSKVDIRSKNECWEWTGNTVDGYGHFALTHSKTVKAHRFSYELKHGQIPSGFMVLHRCDNRKCVNSNHLFLGTHTDNMKDRNAKNRQAKGDRHGAKIHPEKFRFSHSKGAPLGSKNPRTHLTENDVIEIKRLLKTDMSQTDIGKKFGVTRFVIWKIKFGYAWQHIKENLS